MTRSPRDQDRPTPCLRGPRAGVVVPFDPRPRPADARGGRTPAGTLRLLLDGNRRFVAGLPARSRGGARVVAAAPPQAPSAAVLGCADSGMDYEAVFDQPVGNLFVAEVAGNVARDGGLASLEFAAGLLDVDVILVLGHTGCRAVATALAGKPVGELPRRLASAHDRARRDIAHAVEDNVRAQRQALLEGSSVIAARAGCGTLTVAAAVYDGTTGTVRVVA